MDVRRISPALTTEQKLTVVTLAEAKMQARVSHSFEDSLITSFIAAAYDYLAGRDGWLNRYCLLKESYAVYFPAPRPGPFTLELPMRPFIDVDAFEWRQGDGSYVAVDPSLFAGTGGDVFGTLARVGGSWPYSGPAHPLAYRVTFSAGHATAAEIPEPLKQSIRLLVAEFYDNRTASADVMRPQALFGLQALAGRYRIAKDHS